MQQTEKYLQPTPSIDCDNESIKQQAEDLTKGQEKDADKAKSVYQRIVDLYPESKSIQQAKISLVKF